MSQPNSKVSGSNWKLPDRAAMCDATFDATAAATLDAAIQARLFPLLPVTSWERNEAFASPLVASSGQFDPEARAGAEAATDFEGKAHVPLVDAELEGSGAMASVLLVFHAAESDLKGHVSTVFLPVPLESAPVLTFFWGGLKDGCWSFYEAMCRRRQRHCFTGNLDLRECVSSSPLGFWILVSSNMLHMKVLGYGCSGVPSKGRIFFSSLDEAGDWERKGSYHTAWAVPCDSSCTCSYAYGHGPAIGPHTGERCWPLPAGLWRAIAPLMQPWCAEGEVPTAANLNLYRGWKSCVGWHCDDEPLFGKCGDVKLNVSVSLGNFEVFRWRRQSCPSDEGRSCRLDHGDILVMDGQCQDEFLHRTDPFLEQDRINITFRWVKQHVSSCPLLKAGVACCLPTCAQGLSVPVMVNTVNGVFWAFWFLLGVLCIWGVLVFLGSLLCTRLGLLRCASCWTRPLGGGWWGHYLGNPW